MTDFIIYGLIDPRTNKLRYIGQSSKGLKRPKEHWSNKCIKRKDYCHNWIRNLISSNLLPQIVVLEDVKIKDKKLLDEAEIRLISFFKRLGYKLVNMTEGGHGSLGRIISESTRKKISDKIKGNRYRLGTGKEKVDIVCNVCSKLFKWKSKDRKFCSTKCRAKAGITKETLEKCKMSSKTRKEVIRLSDNKIFKSLREASSELGFSRIKLRRMIKDKEDFAYLVDLNKV